MRRVLVLAALALVLVSACTRAEPTTSSSAAPATSSPSPSVSPTSASPTGFASFEPAPAGESAEEASVRAAFEQFQSTMWVYVTDADLMDLTRLNEITTGEGTRVAWGVISDGRAAGTMPVGDLRFYDITITPPATNAQGVRLSKVSYCADPTNLKILDTKTGDFVEGLTPTKVPYVVTMELMSDDEWRVSDYSNGKQAC